MTVKTDQIEVAVRAAVEHLHDAEMDSEAQEIMGLMETLRLCQLNYNLLLSRYGEVLEERNQVMRDYIKLKDELKQALKGEQ